MDLVNQFDLTRREFLNTVSSLTETEAEKMVLPAWNIKGVLAHMAGWDTYFASIARQLTKGEDVPYRGDRIDEWNERLVSESEHRSWDEVRDEFVNAGEAFLAEYRDLDFELWERRFWTERKPTPSWVVNHNTGHYREHLEEILRHLEQ